GLDRGDFINTVDGEKIATVADLERIIRAKKPGDVIKVGFESRGETQEATITLRASPRVEFVTFEAAGREVTEAIRAFRTAWVGSKAH
ncbi:MAG TPA: PDZ domain-containing protein, partial [Gemmatimonadales bacterium]|nr:PDZ domain-containing protein [Gemmatimonadales bacterium]